MFVRTRLLEPLRTKDLWNHVPGYTENIGNYAPMGEWDFNWFSFDQQAQERPHYLSDGGVFALIGWLKGPDGVYRTMNGDQYFPNRGIQLYDTYYPTVRDLQTQRGFKLQMIK